jgi:hypothetical protein
MATPLIRTIQSQGGSFYAFSSAARDLTRTNNNPQLNFEFSKYVLLNIPNVQSPVQNQNYLQFRAVDGAIFNGLNADDNINLIESLQNYALNLESLILADNDYNSSIKQTVSERVFFKWLKELGALRFRESNQSEKNPAITEKRFVEEDTLLSGTRRYERVVEYIGSIDAINHVDKAGEAYQEIYINVPTKVGNTPVVLFKALSDNNYQPNMIISPGNNEFIVGRSTSSIHPAGLSMQAFYDYDAPVVYTDADANWHGSIKTDSYYTEPITFEDPTSISITKVDGDYGGSVDPFTDITFLRSKLDGISIDFENDSYTDIVVDPKIATIQEYNSTTRASNFEFNAVAVYYDLYEVSNPDNRATNLYGILFLNNLTPTTQGSFIERYKKVKPNDITGLNGNSFGFKINLKQDTSIDSATIVSVINDYNTFSMDLFLDVSAQMQEAVKIMYETQANFYDVINRVNELENSVYTSENVTELKARVDDLEAQIQNANLALSNSTAIIDLIGRNSDDIQSIISGTIPVNLQYNTDVIKNGDGILVDKSVPNKIKITNKNQQYLINQIYTESTFENVIDSSNPLNLNQSNIQAYMKLKLFTNMIRFNVQNSALSNVKIYIDDQGVRFKEGQVIRFVFDTPLALNGKNIVFYTDKTNKFGLGVLNKIIGTIPAIDLIGTKPILELTCIDEVNYKFVIDVLR